MPGTEGRAVKEALFFEPAGEGKIRCTLCFHRCVLAEGDLGFCLARRNVSGRLIAETYGKVISAHMDPIEKKPLYHFHPGTDVLSVAAPGCNLACPFCQNAEISRRPLRPRESIDPDELVALTTRSGSAGIAYTYTEPLVWFEYVLESAKAAHKAGLYNVIVSNGTIEEEPLKMLLPYIDAANIDIKGDRDFYSKVLKGDLESTLRTVRMLYRSGAFLEVTNLLIPDGNDSEEQIAEIVSFIESLDPTIPFHISRYYPHGGYPAPATPVDTMLHAFEQARSRLAYVYLGNVLLAEGLNTHCPSCGNLLVERTGFQSRITGISANRCSSCGREVDLIL
ncbi:AmmeMemoRadiSam system radical SAM enzyme [candidate division WOR-3 bacterium]|uniref:AmmeMemoRadiSam system radical SAM enzyme n=1 Tax=candidate division WOR-3 bacterium TaxID=2052148 RepID=A0A9D5K7S7_UNCW3|nr:AmmeMemoRadiSam system radical SAM enzyme [candidate division WOR-3 bacterium]MBD3363862.1 AmmeMemoRadiSam system radical SAM enzyme [candidate division WOR-3 bacterium]